MFSIELCTWKWPSSIRKYDTEFSIDFYIMKNDSSILDDAR